MCPCVYCNAPLDPEWEDVDDQMWSLLRAGPPNEEEL